MLFATFPRVAHLRQWGPLLSASRPVARPPCPCRCPAVANLPLRQLGKWANEQHEGAGAAAVIKKGGHWVPAGDGVSPQGYVGFRFAETFNHQWHSVVKGYLQPGWADADTFSEQLRLAFNKLKEQGPQFLLRRTEGLWCFHLPWRCPQPAGGLPWDVHSGLNPYYA